jgi:hypothetical protein
MKETYWNLLDKDWTLSDIDEMDIYYYIDLLLYKANKEYKSNVEAILAIL